MTQIIPFRGHDKITVGIELELQLVNLQSFNLAMEAKDFLRRLSAVRCPGEIKPEITQAMIEINSSVHHSYLSLLQELHEIRNIIAGEASRAHIGVCGGGTHPFQKWQKQRIYKTRRFNNISDEYGYLAKQFTVFGQHIHVACQSGDDALYLCHAMARYIPHFIALAAASPFQQGVDTAFDCSRLAVISAFPLSGTPPWVHTWQLFEEYFTNMVNIGVIKSIKDFYWDIRPKPEFGTVELRVCDTPLSVQKAAQLGAFMQCLARWLLEKRPRLSKEIYSSYLINRFRAARYGLQGEIIDPIKQEHTTIADDILRICQDIGIYAGEYNSEAAMTAIQTIASMGKNDADWLRERFNEVESLDDMVRAQVEYWEKYWEK